MGAQVDALQALMAEAAAEYAQESQVRPDTALTAAESRIFKRVYKQLLRCYPHDAAGNAQRLLNFVEQQRALAAMTTTVLDNSV